MKTLAAFAVGVLTGLAFVRIPHYVDAYADHSLPPERVGDKFLHKTGGGEWSEGWPHKGDE